MGKIRVKSFGDQEEEKKLERKLEARKVKKLEKIAKEAEEETKEEVKTEDTTAQPEVAAEQKPEESKKSKKSQTKKSKENPHSKKYNSLLEDFDRTKIYTLSEALQLLEKLQRKSFDETVELHINTLSQGVSGNVTLPHGTGKKTRVAIVDDKLILEIEKGIVGFDILVAEPSFMPKLAKVAKVLGPRGLMPNPKNGTISANPQDLVKKYEGGQINFKTETKAPIIHLTVGKMSFGPQKLSENIESLISAVKKQNIANATLKSTMSPGIKIKI